MKRILPVTAVVSMCSAFALADATTKPADSESRPDTRFFQFTREALPAPKMEKAAFLGVGATAVDEALASQLDLQRGAGLSVAFVEPGSPADSAGIQQHDVLQKIDDQILFNAEQLAALIRTHKANDVVNVTLIRKGKPQTLAATLVERDLPVLGAQRFNMIFNNGAFAVPHGGIHMNMPADGGAGLIVPAVPHLEGMPQPPQPPRVIRMMPGSTSVIARSDGKMSIRVTVQNGEKWLNIVDESGKQLFDGRFDQADTLDALPAEVREKVKRVIEGIEIRTEPATQPTEPKAELAIEGHEVQT